MPTAPCSAAEADVNTAITPSPNDLTTNPSTSSTALEMAVISCSNQGSATESPTRVRISVEPTMSQNTTALVDVVASPRMAARIGQRRCFLAAVPVL
jgi:hypothetical protein